MTATTELIAAWGILLACCAMGWALIRQTLR